jgi:hypothetical protein
MNAMLSVVTLEPPSVSPVHAHPHEQWGVCLEGEWIRIQDGVEHIVLDVFAPPREEYRQAGSGLGSATLAR